MVAPGSALRAVVYGRIRAELKRRTIHMLRKFAVALIATTMLVAPALAGEAVKSTPATPAAATTPVATPAASTETRPDTKIVKKVKKTKVAHRHIARHIAMAKHGKHLTKIAEHTSHVKTAKVAKPAAPSTATASTPSGTTPTATIKTDTAGNTQTIKADKPVKKTKVSNRHNGHKLAMARHGKVKTAKHLGKVKTAKVSKPVKSAAATQAKTTQGTSNNKANVN
jgi:hypothetical protein